MSTRSVTVACLAAYFSVVASGVLLVRGAAGVSGSTLRELLIHVALVAVLASHKVSRTLFLTAPAPYRWLVICLGALALTAQLANVRETTYPFVNWTMYSNESDSGPVYYQFTALTEAGPRPLLPMLGLPLPVRPFSSRLARFAMIANSGNAGASEADRVLRTALTRLVDQYRLATPDAPRVREVVFERCEVPLGNYHGRDSVTCTSLRRIPL